jgi:hypothetical protein
MTLQVATKTVKHAELAASTAYTVPFNSIWVGVTGNIDVVVAGVTVGYDNVPVGLHAISGDSIAATTTADVMVVMHTETVPA